MNKSNKQGAFLRRREKRVLVVGDIHAPFELDGYLSFLKSTAKEWNVTDVVFIGDVIDNHYSSYHESEPQTMGADEELLQAAQHLKPFYKAFPKAYVTIGNHDRIVARKAKTAGLSQIWLRDYSDVLDTPGWTFVENITIDGVLYTHGEGGTARTRMKKELKSVVQGHLHTQAYIDYQVESDYKIFGMQVGCGIDRKSFAMAYGKDYGKPSISCGVILGGHTPNLITANL